MNTFSKLVFIIGPGGTGKSTTGKILAQKLGYRFVDIDTEFCERIEMIGSYIDKHGYIQYCYANSELFEELIREFHSRTVFPLSSGFLVHEESPELVKRHVSLLEKLGVSILLMPSERLEDAIDIVAPRQVSREYMKTTIEKERKKLSDRFYKYLKYGDIKIFSHDAPNDIAVLMIRKLREIHAL